MSINSDVLREARRLHALGFAVLWLKPKSKAPVENAWTTGPRKKWSELEASYRPGYNVGTRLGSVSKLENGYLAVVDVDVKSEKPEHAEEALARARGFLAGKKCAIVFSGRGNGSRHYYGVTKEPVDPGDLATSDDIVRVFMPSSLKPSKRDRQMLTEKEIAAGFRTRPAWEISLMGERQQVVLPPSIHPDSGKNYTWRRAVDEGLPSFDEISRNANQTREKASPGLAATLDDFRVSRAVELSWLPISDDVRRGIIDGDGVVDRSGYLLRATTALLSAGLDRNEVLTVLTDPKTYLGAVGYEHAKTTSRRRAAEWVHRYTFTKIAAERSPVIFSALPVTPPKKLTFDEMVQQDREFTADRNWRQDLDKTKEGNTRATLKNLDLILSNTVKGPVFVKDEFALRINYGVKPPWGGKKSDPIQDEDPLLLKRWLADTERVEPSVNLLREVVALTAYRNRVHPVREWLETLRWDGVPRIDTWIRDFCDGDAPEPYRTQISRVFLLAMVKRVFEPGCQWDYTLVLEGDQGKKKSSMARALAGDRWFMDNLPDLKDKDAMLNLQGKWLIELGELADVKRHDYNQVKAYLTRRVDTVRAHYGHFKSDVPRQSVFIGTINEGQYLKDPTGNRRYWPVKVQRCDDVGFKKVRDQIFAEAMHVYRTENPVLMLTGAAEKQATAAQEARRVDDDYSEMKDALAAFRASAAGRAFPWDRFKSRDLMIGPSAPWGAWATKNYVTQTASQILLSCGFRRGKIEGQRYWYPVVDPNRGRRGRPGADPSGYDPGNFT